MITARTSNENDSVAYKDVNIWMTSAAREEYVYQIDALRASLLHCIGTMKRSRLNRPGFGSNVPWLLFDPVDRVTASLIEIEIFEAAKQEPRIRLEHKNIKVVPHSDYGFFQVVLEYEAPGLLDSQIQHQFKLRSLRSS